MSKETESTVNFGDETMKQVGALEEATTNLEDATAERVASGEEAKGWISFIVQTLLMIFKPGK